MLSIYTKEISAFFSSLVGYIVIGIFLLSLGWIMWVYPETSILENEFATLDQLFIGAPFIFSFIIPALTMRSFAEEHQIGTIELLNTKPLLDVEIILGKFFACMTLVVMMLLPTLIYFYTVYQLGAKVGNIDSGGVLGSYIGLLFLAAAFVAIGLFTSSLTQNIIVSLILGIVACSFIYWGFDLISDLPEYFGKGDIFLQKLGIDYHYNAMGRGLLDTRDLLYFIALIGVFLCLTLLSYNSVKWYNTRLNADDAKRLAANEEVKNVKPLSRVEQLIVVIPGIVLTLVFGLGLISGIVLTILLGLFLMALIFAFKGRGTITFDTLIQPLLTILILVAISVLGNFIFTKFDLTDDDRFTLTDPSINILKNVDDVLDITILLEGDLPANYARLQQSIKEMLDDFRSYSSYIEYSFENPTEGAIDEVQKNVEALGKQGINPISIQIPGVDSREVKYIYPYALINYKGDSRRVNLLEPFQPQVQDAAIINKSVNLLEYKLINAISKIETSYRKIITYTIGHDELSPLQFADLRNTLKDYYTVGGLNLDSLVVIDQQVDLLIVPKPRAAFTEKELFKIDQYVMNGGKILWALDVMDMSLDSIARYGGAPYIASELPAAEGISNLLFKYGIRIRPSNFIFDAETTRIPLQTGVQGNTPKFDLFNWWYHPMMSPKSEHPIVKGLDRVNLFFPTVIDTAIGVRTLLKKEVLLSSSPNSKERPNTHRFSFDEVNVDPVKLEYNDGNKPVAVLLEGVFPSAYRNRVSTAMSNTLREIGAEFKDASVPTKMIVITDGDVMKNLVDARSKQYSPLGFNKYENYTFANKDFMINCIEYLLDEKGVLESRSKEIKLRLLNKVEAQKNKRFWQMLNLGVPLLFLLLFGLLFTFLRRRRYTR